jgi:uroporphyrinogen-III synthase
MAKMLEVKVRVISKKLSPADLRAIDSIEQYDWIIFTSKNAVAFFSKVISKKKNLLTSNIRVAAVGPETSRALKSAQLPVHFVSPEATSESLAKTVPIQYGDRILFPCSAIAPQDAVRTLRQRGAQMRTLTLYDTHAQVLSPTTKRALLSHTYTQLIFKSPSGVHGLLKQLTAKEKHVVRSIHAQCIGPTTAQAAKMAGFMHVSIQNML